MGVMSGWLMDATNENCTFEADPDVSGLGVRIGFAALPGITAAEVAAMWFLAIPMLAIANKSRNLLKWRNRIASVITQANALQLSLAIVYLSVTLSKVDSTDWFHMRFLLDASALSGLCTAVVSLVHSQRGSRTVHSIAVFIFVVLFLTAAGYNIAKLKASMLANPGCYDKRFISDCLPVVYAEMAGISFVLLYSTFFDDLVRSWQKAVSEWISWLCSISTWFFMVVMLYFSFADYEDMKKLLKKSEAEWNYGQVLTPFFAAVGIIVSLWMEIESELGDDDSIDDWCLRKIFGDKSGAFRTPMLPEPQIELQTPQPVHQPGPDSLYS